MGDIVVLYLTMWVLLSLQLYFKNTSYPLAAVAIGGICPAIGILLLLLVFKFVDIV